MLRQVIRVPDMRHNAPRRAVMPGSIESHSVRRTSSPSYGVIHSVSTSKPNAARHSVRRAAALQGIAGTGDQHPAPLCLDAVSSRRQPP